MVRLRRVEGHIEIAVRIRGMVSNRGICRTCSITSTAPTGRGGEGFRRHRTWAGHRKGIVKARWNGCSRDASGDGVGVQVTITGPEQETAEV